MENSFRTDKITRILSLYQRLMNGEHIDKESFSLEHNINGRTFDRDIQDIRMFLSDSFSQSELIFDSETGLYRLTGERPEYMDRVEVTIIAKVLLSSKTLREDEMKGLFHSLLSVVSNSDQKIIKQYLRQNADEYVSDIHFALIKLLGDLYGTIQAGWDIELFLRDDIRGQVKRMVSPLEISIFDSRFCLIVAENQRLTNLHHYPIEQIERFVPLHTTYARTLKEKYYKDKEAFRYGKG